MGTIWKCLKNIGQLFSTHSFYISISDIESFVESFYRPHKMALWNHLPLGAQPGSTWCARTRNGLNASFQLFPLLHTKLNQVGHQVVPQRHLVRLVEVFDNQNALREIISHNCAVFIFYFLFPTSFTLRY